MRFPPAAQSLTAETFWQFLHGADQTLIAARIIRRYPDKKAGPETREENKTGPASPSKLTAHYTPLFLT